MGTLFGMLKGIILSVVEGGGGGGVSSTAMDAEWRYSWWYVAMGSQLRLRFEQEVRATETEVYGLRNQTKNLETLLEAEADMKKAAEAKNVKLTKELESLRVWFSNLQVNNNQLSQQVSDLQAQITGEEKTKAAFEQFKKYEDDRVEQRCTEIDVLLDKLSVDFDEELYPHMLTAIAGRRWVIGHGLRLAVMKCAESTELRQVFANVVSFGIAKGMSKGLKYSVEHGCSLKIIFLKIGYVPCP
ncbi:hypothetical protein Tco_0411570 [Tanacetum coccineum]